MKGRWIDTVPTAVEPATILHPSEYGGNESFFDSLKRASKASNNACIDALVREIEKALAPVFESSFDLFFGSPNGDSVAKEPG